MPTPSKYMDMNELVDLFVVPKQDVEPAWGIYKLLFYIGQRPGGIDYIRQQYDKNTYGGRYTALLGQILESLRDKSPESKRFQSQVMFVANNFLGPTVDEKRFVGKQDAINQSCQKMDDNLGMIHDPVVRGKLLDRMAGLTTDMKQKLHFLEKMVENGHVSRQQIINRSRDLVNADQDISQIVDAVVARAGRDIADEMARETPNAAAIDEIRREINTFAGLVGAVNPTRAQAVRDQFAQTPAATPVRAIPAPETELERLRREVAELREQNAQLTRELAAARGTENAPTLPEKLRQLVDASQTVQNPAPDPAAQEMIQRIQDLTTDRK